MKGIPNAITITLIWQAHALNRDEKMGGNILSIKKLSRGGKTYSFLSKTAIRHYLWETLRRAFGWEPTPTGQLNKVIQFALHQQGVDIRRYPEIDLFGYMYTPKTKQTTLTRKSPVGITKAIAIEEYTGDMAFYANHDLVERARRAGKTDIQPDPFSKEEHSTYYLISFTLDIEKIGYDEWIVQHPHTLTEGKEKREDLNWENYGESNKFKKVVFELSKPEKKKRIRAVLQALSAGLYAQSSGELNTLTPVFFIAAPVKLPVPIFHGRVRASVEENDKLQVEGISDALDFSKYWVEKVKPLCIKATKSILLRDFPLVPSEIKGFEVMTDIEKWMQEIGLSDSNEVRVE